MTLRTSRGRLRAIQQCYAESDEIDDVGERITVRRHLIRLAHEIGERLELERENHKLRKALEPELVEAERDAMGEPETPQGSDTLN